MGRDNYAFDIIKGELDAKQRTIDSLVETIKELSSALGEALKPPVVQYAEPSATPLYYSEEEEDAKYVEEHKDDLRSALTDLGLDANLHIIPSS